MGARIKRKATMAITIPASTAPCLTSTSRSGFLEGGHQLEKLEFALAIAEARGDQLRCSILRDRIADLGGNSEEPGT